MQAASATAAPAGQAAGPAWSCSSCGEAIEGASYLVNDAPFCEPCAAAVYDHFVGGRPLPRLARAFVFGLVAAVIGSIVYYLALKLARRPFMPIAALVGMLVGRAARSGGGGRGGLGTQWIAVFLTYTAIVSTSVPQLLDIIGQRAAVARAARAPAVARARLRAPARPPIRRLLRYYARVAAFWTFVVLLAYLMPFLIVMRNPWLLLIIAFSLWEAWKINGKVPVRIEGPHFADEDDPYSAGPAPGLA